MNNDPDYPVHYDDIERHQTAFEKHDVKVKKRKVKRLKLEEQPNQHKDEEPNERH